MNTTTPRPTQSTIRGWQSDGVLIARSRSMTGRIYRIASYRHYLRCDADLPCPSFEHRGVCQHVKDAARFLEEHSACGEAQRRFSEQTYNDPLRTAIRAQKATQFPTEDQLDDYSDDPHSSEPPSYEEARKELEALEWGARTGDLSITAEDDYQYYGERMKLLKAIVREGEAVVVPSPDPRRGKLQALYR